MRWYRAETYRNTMTGTDETHNPTYELQPTGETILVRSAPWKPSHDSTEGNQFDMVQRTFLTRARPDLLDGVVAIKVRGALYEVTGMNHEAVPTAISVRRCKDGLQDHR